MQKGSCVQTLLYLGQVQNRFNGLKKGSKAFKALVWNIFLHWIYYPAPALNRRVICIQLPYCRNSVKAKEKKKVIKIMCGSWDHDPGCREVQGHYPTRQRQHLHSPCEHLAGLFELSAAAVGSKLHLNVRVLLMPSNSSQLIHTDAVLHWYIKYSSMHYRPSDLGCRSDLLKAELFCCHILKLLILMYCHCIHWMKKKQINTGSDSVGRCSILYYINCAGCVLTELFASQQIMLWTVTRGLCHQ